MLMLVRRRRICEMVQQKTSVLVRDLAAKLDVTEETIRRDLEQLESEGKILRSHGGAVLPEGPEGVLHFSERQTLFMKEKRAIAQEAVKRVAEGDFLFLDPSSTVFELAKVLPDVRMTVISNSPLVALELSSRRHITFISLGGTLVERSLSFLGSSTEKSLKNYHAGKFFFSCKGVDLAGGMSESADNMARLKQAMFANSEQRFLLADSSKFGVKSLTVFGKLAEVEEILTDSGLNAGVVKAFKSGGLKISAVGQK